MLHGQGEAWARVQRQARCGRLHHALVISGAPGAGKSLAAELVARALLCESARDDADCGQCSACRKVAARQHSDLHLVTVAEDKHDISVDQIRAVQAALGHSPVEGGARVVWIDPADRLNEQGQNALLKTLEEPGARTFLILAATRAEALLDTVRSRAQRLYLRPLDDAAVLADLNGRDAGDPGSRQAAALAARGSVGRALELAETGIAELHQSLVAFLRRPNDISALALVRTLLGASSGRREAEARARQVLAILRGLLRASLLGSLANDGSESYFVGSHSTWTAVFEAAFDAELDLDLRIAPEQVLSHVLLQLQEELPRCGAAVLDAAAPR